MAAGFIAVSVVAFIVLGSVLEGIPAIVLFGSVLGWARQSPGAPGHKTLKTAAMKGAFTRTGGNALRVETSSRPVARGPG